MVSDASLSNCYEYTTGGHEAHDGKTIATILISGFESPGQRHILKRSPVSRSKFTKLNHFCVRLDFLHTSYLPGRFPPSTRSRVGAAPGSYEGGGRDMLLHHPLGIQRCAYHFTCFLMDSPTTLVPDPLISSVGI